MSDPKTVFRRVDSCAVCLYFDESVTNTVRRAWDRIAAAGISSKMPDAGWRPHITLSGCRDIRVEEYLPVLQEFIRETEPITITLSSVGYFGAGDHHTLFLAPTITRGLLDLHERHHQMVAPFCLAVSPYYTPDAWVPHCTLALNLSGEARSRAVLLTNEYTLPISGRGEAVGIVHVTRPRVEELLLQEIG